MFPSGHWSHKNRRKVSNFIHASKTKSDVTNPLRGSMKHFLASLAISAMDRFSPTSSNSFKLQLRFLLPSCSTDTPETEDSLLFPSRSAIAMVNAPCLKKNNVLHKCRNDREVNFRHSKLFSEKSDSPWEKKHWKTMINTFPWIPHRQLKIKKPYHLEIHLWTDVREYST